MKNDHLVIHTSLDNRSQMRKEIDAVQLIVCPYDEKPQDAANTLWPELPERLKDMRDIVICPLRTSVAADGESTIPAEAPY